MSARPWYPRYGADFVHGTMGLTLEEKGAYSLCLDLIYDRGGPIPDDARWLAGVCGVSVRRWGALRQRLLDVGKLVLRETGLSNVRAENELENTAKIARKHAENGSKGGNKRAESAAATNENKDLAEAGLKHRARVPQPQLQDRTREDAAPPPDGGVARPPISQPAKTSSSSGNGGSQKPARAAVGDQVDEVVKRAEAEQVLAHPLASDEDRFWALNYRLADKGIAFSRARQLARAHEADGYGPVVAALEKALRARNPSSYLGGVLRERKAMAKAEAGEDDPPPKNGRKSKFPPAIQDWFDEGYHVESDGPGKWIVAGVIRNDDGDEIGW